VSGHGGVDAGGDRPVVILGAVAAALYFFLRGDDNGGD
jgi:hypothetical protein